LLYAELGRIYRLYYDYPKSLEAYQKAAECYERAGKIQHRNYMWFNQSIVYRNLNQYEDSERLLRLAMMSAEEMKDTTLMELCLGNLIMQYIEQHRMREAQTLYEELQQLLVGSSFGSSSFMGELARMYASGKDFHRAKSYLEEGWKQAENSTDSANLYLASAAVSHGQGEDKEAYAEIMKALGLQIQQAHEALQQPVLTAQRDYLSEKLELEAYRLQLEKRLKLLSILMGLLLLVVVCHVFRKIIKKRHEEALRTIRGLEKQHEETEKQKEQAEKDKEQLEKENRKISSLLQKMEFDKAVADETIKNLKNEIFKQEKANDEAISGLVQKLENENKVNVETIVSLRESLESKERVFHQYEQNNEQLQKDLQDAIVSVSN
jgi:tetratricopeptide (TPR) repeat protein